MGVPPNSQRLAALDQALLFLSSITGAVSATIYVVPGALSATGVATLSVILVVTAVFPLYVGYMRGAVELDSLFERVRGWVYLIFGGGIVFLTTGLRELNPPIVTVGPIEIFQSLAFIVGFVIILGMTLRFIDWSYGKIAGRDAGGDERSGFAGVVGALFLAALGLDAFASLGAGFNTLPITDIFPGRLTVLLGAPFFLLPLFYIEFNCHKESALRLADEGYETHVKPYKEKLVGWRGQFTSFAIRVWSWGNVEKRDNRFVKRMIVATTLLVVGNFIVAVSPLFGIPLMALSDVLAYYFLWRYMKGVWESSQVS